MKKTRNILVSLLACLFVILAVPTAVSAAAKAPQCPKKQTLEFYNAYISGNEMPTEGVARQAGSNVGVGITGLAGPGGETPEKKAGLVYIGVSVNGKTKVNKYQLNGNRQKVRETAVCRALTMVRHALVEEFL